MNREQEISCNTTSDIEQLEQKWKEHADKFAVVAIIQSAALFINPVVSAIMLPEFVRQAYLSESYANKIREQQRKNFS